MMLRKLPAFATATALFAAVPTARAEAPAPTPTEATPAASSPAAPMSPHATSDAALAQQMRFAKRARTIGIVSLGAGALMIGVGAGLEHKRRTDICKESLSEDHENACDDSLRANVTVLAMGVTFAVGGAVLLGLGQTRINRLRRSMNERGIAFAPAVGRGFAGATFTARF